MLALGFMGSPRKKGNTDFLLSSFMKEIGDSGVRTHVIRVVERKIMPCIECGVCEKTGFCSIDDDMNHIYPLLREADVVVLATPIFFYNAPAQAKALIDRSQTLWSRKYSLNLIDPGRKIRRGFLLSLGATKGVNLFEGMKLTAKYFFDALGAGFEGSLTYKKMEKPGDMADHPEAANEIKEAAGNLLKPYAGRKKILFACRENACRSQMASAFARYMAGDRMDVSSGGSAPSDSVNPVMTEVMQEKGIDMGFRKPKSVEKAVSEEKPDVVITMGCNEECPFVPGARTENWDLPDPAGKSIEFMRSVRNEIEKKVTELMEKI
jgi:multimeric flavodoxin WrbA